MMVLFMFSRQLMVTGNLEVIERKYYGGMHQGRGEEVDKIQGWFI
jgi:hypothetical protein